jgi:hypothetical protein
VRDVEVIVGAAAMTRDKALDAVAPTLSVTVRVKLKVPPDEGTPLISPVLAVKFSPPGSDPPASDQVNGAVPPARAITAEYVIPTVPCDSDVVVTDNAEAIAIDNPGDNAVAPTLSVIRTIKLNVPSADGVPLMVPVLVERVNPVGIAPDITDQAKGEVPPVASIVCE